MPRSENLFNIFVEFLDAVVAKEKESCVPDLPLDESRFVESLSTKSASFGFKFFRCWWSSHHNAKPVEDGDHDEHDERDGKESKQF